MRKSIGVSLSEEVLKELDVARGLAPRSAIIEQLLRESLVKSTFEAQKGTSGTSR